MEKVPDDSHKRLTVAFQLGHVHMGYLGDPVVHLRIDPRPDQTAKLPGLLKRFIQADRSDFYNFKRKMVNRPLFSVRALIPFQIQYNIILHKILLCAII